MGEEESKGFTTELSYILIGGVALSFAIEVVGLVVYYAQTGGLSFDYSSQWRLTGSNFFAYVAGLLSNPDLGAGPIRVMALGITILMLTPYVRVLASAVHFGTTRNVKFLLFTIFVLTVLTLSLSFR